MASTPVKLINISALQRRCCQLHSMLWYRTSN